MRKRVVFFVFSGIAALGAAFIVYWALMAKEARIQALNNASMSIAVAAADVPAGRS